MSWRERLGDWVTERTGMTVTPRERLELLESSDQERRLLQKELDLLAYTALDYVGGQPQELKAVERRKLAQKARIVWMRDPLAGAAVDLMNDFTFGRGLQKPKAADKLVQDVIDEAWDDPDNQEVFTTLDAQVRLGTDLSLQANLFLKVFDDGDDGKVKLSLLKNDLVETVVRDPENHQRILWFVVNEEPYQDWDYDTDQPLVDLKKWQGGTVLPKIYYPHWRNVDLLKEEVERGDRPMPNMPDPKKIGEGKIFHIAINRTTDMAMGHPPMDRLLRWFNAYNRFMDARVDLTEAAAAFVMKRKVKGTPTQLQKMATQALSRRSSLGMGRDPDIYGETGPKAASIITENEAVEHEPFKIDTGASNAMQDAQMLRSNVSAAIRFPQTYLGDATNSTLATATSLELPVLKAVESRQEKFEAAVRFFCDRVIERAVETERIPTELDDDERAELEKELHPEMRDQEVPDQPPLGLAASYEDSGQDEADTERDLSYEFSMPNPLKRMITDMATVISTTAQTFDPNNTNTELSRVLLGIMLGEGLEIEDPQKIVDKVFPEGYVDPAIQQAQAMGPPSAGEFGTIGPDGQMHDESNPYGAPMTASSPDAMGITEARTLGRGGGQVVWLRESRYRLSEDARRRLAKRTREVFEGYDSAAEAAVGEART